LVSKEAQFYVSTYPNPLNMNLLAILKPFSNFKLKQNLSTPKKKKIEEHFKKESCIYHSKA